MVIYSSRLPLRECFFSFFFPPCLKNSSVAVIICFRKLCRVGGGKQLITREDLKIMKFSELLSKCGVKPTDTVTVSSALNSEAEAVLDDLLEDLTGFLAPGMLIMPVGKNPDTQVPNGIFDPRNSVSGEGMLSEKFRKMPDVVRSLHPTGSLAVRGKNAEELAAGHEMCISCYSAASPWWRIFQRSGKYVLIDCGLEAAAIIAAAEEWAGAAALSKRFLHRRIVLENGKRRRVKIKVHTGRHFFNYPRIEDELQRSGFLSKGTWEQHRVIVLDIAESVNFILQRLARKKRFFAARRKGVYLKKS